jgi:GT2 family glycosyltransferase
VETDVTDDYSGQGVVVVLSWFGKDDTLACVESLMSDELAARILVVDNGSFDGTLEAVAERWPSVATLQTGSNLGFAGGMNAGLKWALARNAAHVTVLNNDTLVPPQAIEALQTIAATGVAVCPEIYYRDDPQKLWFGGGKIYETEGFPGHLAPEELAEAVDGVRPTQLVTGCCITASADTWRRVGPFDERFFLNFEDSEWSVRATRLGVPLRVADKIRILHSVSASFARSPNSLGTFYYIRNGLLFGRLVGNSRRVRSQFVRYLGGPVLKREWRARRPRAFLLALTEIGCGILSDAFRRYGPAPRTLKRLASRATRPAVMAPG